MVSVRLRFCLTAQETPHSSFLLLPAFLVAVDPEL